MSNLEKETKRINKFTLEATRSAQELLRKQLDILIAENRPLDDEQERERFFRILTYSTLGLGKDVIHRLPNPHGSGFLCKADLETFARWMAYCTDAKVDAPSYLYRDDLLNDNPSYEIEIKYLWESLRNRLFTVFPRAIERSSAQSREQVEFSKSTGFEIGK